MESGGTRVKVLELSVLNFILIQSFFFNLSEFLQKAIKEEHLELMNPGESPA